MTRVVARVVVIDKVTQTCDGLLLGRNDTLIIYIYIKSHCSFNARRRSLSLSLQSHTHHNCISPHTVVVVVAVNCRQLLSIAFLRQSELFYFIFVDDLDDCESSAVPTGLKSRMSGEVAVYQVSIFNINYSSLLNGLDSYLYSLPFNLNWIYFLKKRVVSRIAYVLLVSSL